MSQTAEQPSSETPVAGLRQEVKALDEVITTLERQIWDAAFPVHGNDKDTDEAVRSPDFDSPTAAMRSTILQTRNNLAQLCDIDARPIHDYSREASWVVRDC